MFPSHDPRLDEAFVKCTRLINGGTIGLADRRQWLIRAKAVVDTLKDYASPTTEAKPVPTPTPSKPKVETKPKIPTEVKDAIEKLPTPKAETTDTAKKSSGIIVAFTAIGTWFHENWEYIAMAGGAVVAAYIAYRVFAYYKEKNKTISPTKPKKKK